MKIIDLSTPFDMNYSVRQPPEIEPVMQITRINSKIKSGFAEVQYTMTTHSGTHINAPRHVFTRDFENAPLEIKKGDRVLVHTGWGRFFEKEPRNSSYLANKRPGLTLDGAEWLAERKVRAYGQDTMDIQHPSHSFSLNPEQKEAGLPYPLEPVHRLLLGNDIILIEHLTNLDQVANRRVTAGFFPLPLRGTDGANVIGIAFLDE